MKNVSVIAFYSFFRIDDLVQMEKQVQNFFQSIDIKGTVLIGPEPVLQDLDKQHSNRRRYFDKKQRQIENYRF